MRIAGIHLRVPGPLTAIPLVALAAIVLVMPRTATAADAAPAAVSCRDLGPVATKLCGGADPLHFPCTVTFATPEEVERVCIAECGDGILDPGEECDDGNNANGDGCSATCTKEPPGGFCGDGIVQPPEECDDGNNVNGDGCSATCKLEPPGFC